MLKGQDMVVLAAIIDKSRVDESYLELGKRVCLSASETHASVKRLQEAALLNSERRMVRHNVIEFLVHGMKYAFPFKPVGMLSKGFATSYAAPVAEGAFATTGADPVWSSQDGDVCGQAFEPLYATVPVAASRDRALYDRLALFDMLRGGRIRERRFAEA